MVLYENPFLVNRDVWNELPADLQEMVLVAADYADSVSQWKTELGILEVWEIVIDYGIIPVTWSKEDADKFTAAQVKWAEAIAEKDANTAELLQICQEYREFAGL